MVYVNCLFFFNLPMLQWHSNTIFSWVDHCFHDSEYYTALIHWKFSWYRSTPSSVTWTHTPDEQMFSQSRARLVTGKRFKVLSYVKGFYSSAKSLMFQRHAATRIAAIRDTRYKVLFSDTPSSRTCTRFIHEWIRYFGCVPEWRGYRVKISCFVQVHSSTDVVEQCLLNTCCHFVMDYSIKTTSG